MGQATMYCCSDTCAHPDATGGTLNRSFKSDNRADFVELNTDEYEMAFCLHCVLKGVVHDKEFLEFFIVHLSASR